MPCFVLLHITAAVGVWTTEIEEN